MSNNTVTTTQKSFFIVSNQLYDFLKFAAQILLPAIGSLYFGLSQIWDFPNGEEVVGTISLMVVFLGTTLRISTTQYNKSEAKFDGSLVVDTSDASKDVYSFEVATPLDTLKNNQTLTIKVNKPTS